MQQFDVIILGAGAAGLMCAIEAGRRGRRVLLLDHADRVGKKILISGGGRCNFTNLHCAPENFISENPHFVRSAFSRYTPADFVAMVEAHGIAYHEKTLGQLFCDRSARDIVTMLERECEQAKAHIQLGTSVEDVSASGTRRFEVATSSGHFEVNSVVVATGGLSIPKMGATGWGYELAGKFGLHVIKPRPGLVPLTFSAEDSRRWTDLAGLSAEVVASAGRASFREKLLITHRGLSGPAVLQISSFVADDEAIRFDLAPERDVLQDVMNLDAARDGQAVLRAVRAVLPSRFAERWLLVHAEGLVGSERLIKYKALQLLEEQLHAWEIKPAGTEGYAKAEVTVGGVDTAELNPKTLECRKVPGLFFIGEVVDVTGWLGGFNFQWAWASGFCAGQVA